MKAKRVSREEQLKLIMECRSSGLSDYQWCEAHGIHAGTFYNWVSKLRKAGVTIPNSEGKHLGIPVHQDVVKVDLVPESAPTATIMEQNTRRGVVTTRVRWIWNYCYQEKIIQKSQIPMSFSSVILIHLKKKSIGIHFR